MLRRVLSLLIVSTLTIPGRAEGPAIPQNPEKLAQVRRDALSWQRHTLGEAYEKVGKKNPRWDEAARAALEVSARYYAHDGDKPPSRRALSLITHAATVAVRQDNVDEHKKDAQRFLDAGLRLFPEVVKQEKPNRDLDKWWFDTADFAMTAFRALNGDDHEAA